MKQIAFLLAAIGCGSSSTPAKPDAPTPDTPSGPDAAATGMVSAHVVNSGTAVAGATVVFSLPSGEVGSTATTSATGDATGMITAGGSVTAVIVTGSAPSANHLLMTVFDVQPGDQLTMGAPNGPPATGAAKGSVAASFTGSVTNATNYTTDIGCNTAAGGTAATVTMPLTASCLASAGTFDVIASATDTNGTLLAYTVGSALAPPGVGNTLNQAMPAWRTDPAFVTTTITNGPPNQVVQARATIHDDPVVYSNFPGVQTMTDAGGAATIVPPWPKSVGNAVSWTVQLVYPASISGQPVKGYSKRTSTLTSTSQTIDAAAIPTLTSRTVDVASGHDTPMMAWTATGPATMGQGVLVQVGWQIANIGSYTWLGATRADALSVQFPRLPDSLSDDRVSVLQPFDQAIVFLLQSDLFADAGAFRAHWGDFLVAPARDYNVAISAIQ